MSDFHLRNFLKSLKEPRFGVMPDVVKLIDNALNVTQEVRLTTDYIGEGANLYHVSVWAGTWPAPTLWLVAADDEDGARVTAIQKHCCLALDKGQITPEEAEAADSFPEDDQVVYLIGTLL